MSNESTDKELEDLTEEPVIEESTTEGPEEVEEIEAEVVNDIEADIDAFSSEDPVEVTLEDEVEKWRDAAARSQADLDNYRKRMAREKTEAIQYANGSLLSSLLPVVDNFDMGLMAAKNEDEDSMIYRGMAMVNDQLQNFLTENKVEVLEVAEGTDFDPNLHEALKQEASDTVAEGKVLYTMRKGYKLRDRLLRPANVVVSSGGESADDADTEEAAE
ncbi:MAG: nucleotide exchange factor GrpE [Verrucomicrobiota bacterium]